MEKTEIKSIKYTNTIKLLCFMRYNTIYNIGNGFY